MDEKALTTFQYHQNPDGLEFPIIPIRLQYKNTILDSSALIDSGATISVFRSYVADYFGIKIDKGKLIDLGGVGGRIKGYIHRLNIEVAGKKFITPIVFSKEYLVSLNILGRDSFFKNFTITFQESKRQVKVE